MKFWTLLLSIGFATALIASQKRFWKNQPKTRTFSERLNRELSIDLASLFFSLSIVAWIYSATYWLGAPERQKEERKQSDEERSREIEEWVWERDHSTRPENYPAYARPNDPWAAMDVDCLQRIDSDYEYKIRPGYAPKF